MSRDIYFITHPDVVIDPSIPVPRWRLSERGRHRMRCLLTRDWTARIEAIYCSTEQKTLDVGAAILSEATGIPHHQLATLGENDRSATGYLPKTEFEATVDAFFAQSKRTHSRMGAGRCRTSAHHRRAGPHHTRCSWHRPSRGGFPWRRWSTPLVSSQTGTHSPTGRAAGYVGRTLLSLAGAGRYPRPRLDADRCLVLGNAPGSLFKTMRRRPRSALGVYGRGGSAHKRVSSMGRIVSRALGVFFVVGCAVLSHAQVPPSSAERSGYTGLLAAAARGDAVQIKHLTSKGEKTDVRDGFGRTPLHVAVFLGHHEAMRELVAVGADPNALENDRYDIVTIAAVANDVPTLEVALALGASAKNVTSRYDGTALIAAAHLGHVEAVRTLIRAGAPLDHVNNLGWTALLRVHRARRWRPASHRNTASVGQGRSKREPGRSRWADTALARARARVWSDGVGTTRCRSAVTGSQVTFTVFLNACALAGGWPLGDAPLGAELGRTGRFSGEALPDPRLHPFVGAVEVGDGVARVDQSVEERAVRLVQPALQDR